MPLRKSLTRIRCQF